MTILETPGPTECMPLSDFPLVFISYDEPWAEDGFAAVRKVRPDAIHVQGVKGLNACHVAASEAAGSEWFLTVDADSVLDPSIENACVPATALSPNFLPYWASRNVANGIVSGNGCLKLWPRDLVHRMRSHEAAPKGRVSLDSDIPLIEPGITRLVPMPGCHSIVDPTQTAFHAFRAGFRETYFISWLLEKLQRRKATVPPALNEVLGLWCNLGRHVPNGLWLLYGARMGYWASLTWRDFDSMSINDVDWFRAYWEDRIASRIGWGGAQCPLSGHRYDADRLSEEIDGLAQVLESQGSVPMADFDAAQSALIVGAGLFPILRSPGEVTQFALALKEGRGVAANPEEALRLFETASHLGDRDAVLYLGLCKATGEGEAERAQAVDLLQAATDLGSSAAPYHLANLHLAKDPPSVRHEVDALLDLAAERGFKAPEAV